jgi:hypothetical protein
MTIMDYQFFVLLAPTLALVIYVIVDAVKSRRMQHESQN